MSLFSSSCINNLLWLSRKELHSCVCVKICNSMGSYTEINNVKGKEKGCRPPLWPVWLNTLLLPCIVWWCAWELVNSRKCLGLWTSITGSLFHMTLNLILVELERWKMPITINANSYAPKKKTQTFLFNSKGSKLIYTRGLKCVVRMLFGRVQIHFC